MKRSWAMASALVIGLGVLGLVLGYSRETEDPYNQMVTIKGKVEILNHPELGRTMGNGVYLLFQRVDCKRCLIAATADGQGKYQIRVGRGRYKVIVDNPTPPTYNMLAPDQPKFIDATMTVQDNQFDINLVVASGR